MFATARRDRCRDDDEEEEEEDDGDGKEGWGSAAESEGEGGGGGGGGEEAAASRPPSQSRARALVGEPRSFWAHDQGPGEAAARDLERPEFEPVEAEAPSAFLLPLAGVALVGAEARESRTAGRGRGVLCRAADMRVGWRGKEGKMDLPGGQRWYLAPALPVLRR